MASRSPRVTFLNRYFYPDHSATSELLSALAFDLSRRGFNIAVITSRLRYDDTENVLPSHQIIHGVEVWRVWTPAAVGTGFWGVSSITHPSTSLPGGDYGAPFDEAMSSSPRLIHCLHRLASRGKAHQLAPGHLSGSGRGPQAGLQILKEIGCGFAVSPHNVTELKDRILQLARSPQLGRSMGARARAAFEQQWDKSIAVTTWERLLNELVNSGDNS